MRKKKIAIVGAGIMGTNHARTISKSSIARVSYVIDLEEKVGTNLAASCNADWKRNFDEVRDIDAVILATPTQYHYDLAHSLIERGVPVLIEKPITSDITSTRELLKLAISNRTPITCGLVERYNPAFQTAIQLITEPIHVVSIRHSPYTPRILGGVGWDLLIHDVDLAHQIFGSQLDVSGSSLLNVLTNDPQIEDIADVLLKAPNGSAAMISASRVGQSKIRSLLIYEQDKLFEIDLLRRDLSIHHNLMESEARSFTSSVAYSQQSNLEIPELITTDEPLLGQLIHFNRLIDGKEDLDDEINSILQCHETLNTIYEH
jgi:predicted dehydrogenase